MKAAINELTIALETMETNEPINRAEGNEVQADLESVNAADFRQALAVLKAASGGPIWPGPRVTQSEARPPCDQPPTCEQLSDEELECVFRHSDPSWRHGTRETQVFRRETDGTFWEAKFRLSTDGETNELRDGGAVIRQVWPEQKTITAYA